MRHLTIIALVIGLLLGGGLVGQANSEMTEDECSYEDVCHDWCEDPLNPEIPVNECNYQEVCKEKCEDTGDIDECNYEEVCEDWCEDSGDDDCVGDECDDDDCIGGECDDEGDPEGNDMLCIPMDNVLFDLDIGGMLGFIGYINVNLN